MKWIGISGSWRLINREVEDDVRSSVANIIGQGDGIVSGGALGVDYIATLEALRLNPKANRIKIILPSSLEIFAAHFRTRSVEGVITIEQAELLINLLSKIKESGSLIEMGYAELNEESYYARNSEVLKASDELMAFQVNNSSGTQDTINKARAIGLNVAIKQYEINN